MILRSMASIVAVVAILLARTAAAEEINFQHFLVQDGLPQTQVRVIHQGPDGYIWVGTYGGVARYNGRNFVAFDTRNGLASNTILSINSTNDGRIWVGTTAGLCWKDANHSSFSCSSADEFNNKPVQDILPLGSHLWVATSNGAHHLSLTNPHAVIETQVGNRNVSALDADESGLLWIATRSGLFSLAPGSPKPEPLPLPPSAGSVVLSIQVDGRFLWIGTEKGLFLKQDDTVIPSPRLPEGWSQDNVNGITLSSSGDVWIASNQGVLRHTSDGFDLLAESSGLISDITYEVYADREGVIWIGNDNGLTKYSPGPFVGYRRKHGLLHDFVRTLNEDSDKNLWLGGRAGAQRVPYRDGEWQFDESEVLTEAQGLTDPRIYSIAFPADDEALLATGDGVVHWREGEGVIRHYTMEDGLPTNPSQALKIAADGATWIGTNLGVVRLQNGEIMPAPSEELSSAYVFRIVEGINGQLWFGANKGGVFRVDPDGSVHRFGKSAGVTDKTVWDIAADRSGGLWIGSNGDGLFHMDAEGAVRQYTSADGLVNNFVWQVLVDDQGRVWTYTNTGISRFDGESFRNYGIDDGLLHLEGGATGTIQTHDGTLWFASGDGLMRYVSEFEVDNKFVPPTLIESVTVGGEPVEPGSSLPYSPGLIEIQYAALSFDSGSVIYRYRLLGASEEWSTPAEYRPLSFANLGPGKYVFEVTARKPGGEWSGETARFAFRIQSPFWATTWFWALTVLLFGGTVWLLMRRKMRVQQAQKRELERLIEERTGELRVANLQLQDVNERLQNAAITDPLTGLLNRRYLSNQITTDVAQTRRMYRGENIYPNRDIVFLLLDLDYFKEVNDTYGHAAGDLVLKEYGKLIQEEIRESDYVVRWGGEEFLVIARNTEASQCRVIAERIHRAGQAARFALEDGTELRVTCSVGVSHLPLFGDAPDTVGWEHVVEVADTAVYMAKKLGRNGWISISGVDPGALPDAKTLMSRMKTDLATLIDENVLVVDGSFTAEEQRELIRSKRV